jgi:hypothetical protein
MKKFITALALGVMLMSPSVAGAAGTGATVGLVAKISGNVPSVTLSWGSATFPITVLTNASKGYRVTVTPVSLTNGIGVSLSDVKVSISATSGCWVSGKQFGRDRRTGQYGDVAWVTVSVWQPVGSPKVSFVYKFETFE